MTKTTRFLALVLAAALLLAGAPLSASAAGAPITLTLTVDGKLTWNHPADDVEYYSIVGLINHSINPGSSLSVSNKSRFTQWTAAGVSVDIKSLLDSYYGENLNEFVWSGARTIYVRPFGGKYLDSNTVTYTYTAPHKPCTIYLSGGTADKSTAYPGEKVTVSFPGPGEYEWVVQSGNLLLSESERKQSPLTFTMPEGVVSLRVKQTLPSCTVTFDANGGSGAMTPLRFQVGEDFIFPACAFAPPAGEVFDYWSVAGQKNGFFRPGDSMEVAGDVTVRANWRGDSSGPSNPFVDVPDGKYFTDAVLWAVNHDPQITSGTDSTHFSPAAPCTRAQVVTFLWRAAGCPEPSTTVSPFTDVQNTSQYYYKAVLWAVEKGITTGDTPTTFAPSKACTRGQVVTFLWRFKGQPATAGGNPFVDVKANMYYATPIQWAYTHTPQITNGTDSTHFSPADNCNRGQIVTFLYRAMQ